MLLVDTALVLLLHSAAGLGSLHPSFFTHYLEDGEAVVMSQDNEAPVSRGHMFANEFTVATVVTSCPLVS